MLLVGVIFNTIVMVCDVRIYMCDTTTMRYNHLYRFSVCMCSKYSWYAKCVTFIFCSVVIKKTYIQHQHHHHYYHHPTSKSNNNIQAYSLRLERFIVFFYFIFPSTCNTPVPVFLCYIICCCDIVCMICHRGVV